MWECVRDNGIWWGVLRIELFGLLIYNGSIIVVFRVVFLSIALGVCRVIIPHVLCWL
jgi:hypothetical protein